MRQGPCRCLRLRRARPRDASAASALVRRAKAHWGYGAAFMAHFAPSMAIRPAALARGRCWIVAAGRHPVGYAGRRGRRLEDLFVAPEAMGRGVGSALLRAVVADAVRAGLRFLVLDADPHAAGFYRRHGGRRVGWSPSPWPGDPARRLPRFRLVCRGLRPGRALPILAGQPGER
ncbi:MAG: GNAT family N-acetyltransferase [Alphaproteobacteria bacterium]|nr:GNAT family N-acetyltransferase [Alphaproteobacteria bacterium]